MNRIALQKVWKGSLPNVYRVGISSKTTKIWRRMKKVIFVESGMYIEKIGEEKDMKLNLIVPNLHASTSCIMDCVNCWRSQWDYNFYDIQDGRKDELIRFYLRDVNFIHTLLHLHHFRCIINKSGGSNSLRDGREVIQGNPWMRELSHHPHKLDVSNAHSPKCKVNKKDTIQFIVWWMILYYCLLIPLQEILLFLTFAWHTLKNMQAPPPNNQFNRISITNTCIHDLTTPFLVLFPIPQLGILIRIEVLVWFFHGFFRGGVSRDWSKSVGNVHLVIFLRFPSKK